MTKTLMKNGTKLYPVCNWYKNQHKIYNYYDKCYIKAFDYETATDEDFDAYEEAQRLIEVFDGGVQSDGLVYATYKDYCKIKDIIGAYDYRH